MDTDATADGSGAPAGQDQAPPTVAAVMPAPASPRPRQRLSALVEVILVSGMPTQLAVVVWLWALGVPQTAQDGSLSRTFVFSLLLADSALVLGLIALFMRSGGDGWRQVFLGSRTSGRELVIGLASVPVVLVGVAGVIAGLRTFLPGLHNVPTNPFESLVRTVPDALLMGMVAVVSGGFKEEIQRAFVIRRFGQFLGGERIGLVVFSLAFGAGHVMQGWDVGIVTALLGAFWGILYLWRRSIGASVASHSGFNVAQIVQFLVAGS